MHFLQRFLRWSSISAAVLLTAQGTLHAQITISQSSFQTSLQVETPVVQFLSYDTESIFDLIGISGANQIWDFSALEVIEEKEGLFSVIGSVEEQPGNDDDHLGNAEKVIVTNFPIYNEDIGEGAIFYVIYYTHLLFDGNSAIKLGGIRVEGDDINPDREDELYRTWLTPGQLYLDFPVTYGKNWVSSYDIDSDEVFFTFEIDEEVEVDGWGTLITSSGPVDVLRVKRMVKTSVFGSLQAEDHEFEFYDRTGRLIASITGYSPLFEDDIDELTATWNVFATTTSISHTYSPEIPAEVKLHQNYPNPFNPTTTIGFYLQEAGDIRVTVHDLLGREVATLARGPAASGEHAVVFDAASLPSGVYVYRLKTASQSVTRRLTLLK